MTDVVEINDFSQLEQHRLLWAALLPQTRGATYFQSLDWLRAYWQHYGAEQKLRALIVSSAGKPLGVVPLVVRREPTRIGHVRVLTYPLHDWGSFYGPLGPNASATLALALRHIRRTKRDWDLVDLRWIDADGDDGGRSAQALRAAGLPPHSKPWIKTVWIDLSQGWDTYWATRKSHWRTNVRRCERKVGQLGTVEHLRYRPLGTARGDDDPRWDLYDACEDIARRSWQGASTTGTTISHASVRPFLRDAHVAATKAGALELNVLFVAGQPAAFSYGYHYRGWTYGLRMGFDAEVSRDGLGTVLLHRMLQDSCVRGDHALDLGPGSLECKRHWQTELRTSYHSTYYARTAPKAQALRLKRIARQWLDERRAARQPAAAESAES